MGLAHAVEAHRDQNVLVQREPQELLVEQQAVGGDLEMEPPLAALLHVAGLRPPDVADQVLAQQRLAAEEDDAAGAVGQPGPELQGLARPFRASWPGPPEAAHSSRSSGSCRPGEVKGQVHGYWITFCSFSQPTKSCACWRSSFSDSCLPPFLCAVSR